jgi:hypothetical protein
LLFRRWAVICSPRFDAGQEYTDYRKLFPFGALIGLAIFDGYLAYLGLSDLTMAGSGISIQGVKVVEIAQKLFAALIASGLIFGNSRRIALEKGR